MQMINSLDSVFELTRQSSDILKTFAMKIQSDIEIGIQQIKPTYELLSAQQEQPGLPLSVVGGVMPEGDIWTFYNMVGCVYPFMTRDMKDETLKHLFLIWDQLNYMQVSGEGFAGHTPGIREPLLLSDIQIAKPRYWPGMQDEIKQFKNYTIYMLFNENIINKGNGLFNQTKVRSDFLAAYTFLRNDMVDKRESDLFTYALNPIFLNRVIKGIVAMRFGRAETEDKIKKGIERLETLLPAALHERIKPLREEGGWVDYKKFS